MRHELEAREYKLRLNPKQFLEEGPKTVVGSFFQQDVAALPKECGRSVE